MGIFASFKAQKAYNLHSKGQLEEAKALYAQAVEEGMNQPRYLLSYAVVLIRTGEYQKARELLIKTQKAPGLMPEQKTQLFMNYAACVYKMGEIDKGISILEAQHRKQPAGMIYQTLGYLYIEKLQAKPDPSEPAPVPETPAQPQEDTAVEAQQDENAAESAEEVAAEPVLTPYQRWEQLRDKAEAFIKEAVDYDDEDPICLDNMAQFLYRVLGDKEAAYPWFEKALEQKENQIDTLWFLSRYDLEKGDTEAAVKKLKVMLDGRFSVLNYITKEDTLAELKRLGVKNPEEDE